MRWFLWELCMGTSFSFSGEYLMSMVFWVLTRMLLLQKKIQISYPLKGKLVIRVQTSLQQQTTAPLDPWSPRPIPKNMILTASDFTNKKTLVASTFKFALQSSGCDITNLTYKYQTLDQVYKAWDQRIPTWSILGRSVDYLTIKCMKIGWNTKMLYRWTQVVW